MTLGKARQHGEKQGLCWRSGLRRGLLASGTPPPRLAAASARAWADRVGSGDRWAITNVLRASVHCNGRLWTARASVRQQLVWAMVGPWWREGAGLLPRMPTGAGRLPCAGTHAAMRPGCSHTSPLRTSCRPVANPMEHPSRAPRRGADGNGCERAGTRPACGRARGCGRAREGLWEIPLIPWAPLRLNVPRPPKGTHVGRWGGGRGGLGGRGPGQAGAREGVGAPSAQRVAWQCS